MSLLAVPPNGNILCTDILLEVFQYFYVDELFHSFNGSILHFASMLKKGNVLLHVRQVDAHFRKRILPNVEPNNVLSIRIPNMYQMAPVNLSQFNHVGLLILHNVTERNWPRDLPIRLKSLTVQVRSKDRDAVFKSALGLDSIKRLELNSSFLHFGDFNEILMKPSTVEHLVFKSQRSFIDYEFLINNMPHLKSFQSTVTHYPHRIKTTFGWFPCLHTLDLDCKHMDIDAMIFLLTNPGAYSLRRCRLINVRNSLSTSIAFVLLS